MSMSLLSSGECMEGHVHATNSFAVPFEEDVRDPSIWYLDHHYLESMAYMFSKVREAVSVCVCELGVTSFWSMLGMNILELLLRSGTLKIVKH